MNWKASDSNREDAMGQSQYLAGLDAEQKAKLDQKLLARQAERAINPIDKEHWLKIAEHWLKMAQEAENDRPQRS